MEQFRLAGMDAEIGDISTSVNEIGSDSSPQARASSSDETATRDGTVENMMGYSGFLISRFQNSETFFGASSSFSLVCRTLQFFLKTPGNVPSTANIHPVMLDLFESPMPENIKLRANHSNLQDLPPRETTLRILDTLYAQSSLVFQLLPYTDLRQLADRVYQPVPLRQKFYNQRALVLMHSLLAVGYLFHGPVHKMQGCRGTVDEA